MKTMKTIILSVCAVFILTEQIKAEPIFGTVCLKGYLFAWAKSSSHEREGIALVQIFSSYLGNAGAQPVGCK